MSTRFSRGFSLLEVMVAIAILGLSLSAILASQGDSAQWNKQSANYGVAINLGRCKMSELEEDLLKKGYLENDDIITEVPCCNANMGAVEMTGVAQFICDTKVERVTMPDPPGGFGGSDAGTTSASSSSTPLGSLLSPSGGVMDLDGGLGALSSTLGGTGDNAGGGASGMLSFVMGMVYPSLKPMMEASIRRLTVTVRWKEGSNPKEFSLTQFVTNPQRGGFVSGAIDPTTGQPVGAGTAGATTTGNTTTGNTTTGNTTTGTNTTGIRR